MTNNLNLTPRSQTLIKDCVAIASEFGHEEINCFHLFIAFLNLGLNKNQIGEAFQRFKINVSVIKNEAILFLKNTYKTQKISSTPILDKDCKSVLKSAKSLSNKYDHKYVGIEHIFICLFDTQNTKFLSFLNKIQSFEGVIDYLEKELEEEDTPQNEAQNSDVVGGSQINLEKKHLVANSVCFNEQVASRKIHSLHVNERLIGQLSEILCRKNKNNPLIIGEAGVGKTALVESLALCIVEGKCSDFIASKQIYALDIPMIVAGCKYRGEFEEKIKNILKEAKEDPNVILFIDEIHTIIGAGNPENGMDIANILKPYLARGEISCIGATTFDEYKKTIADDPALNRRFQIVKLEEPTKEETFQLVKAIKSNYESYHFVSYSDDIVKNMVEMSDRYLSGRFPDKVLDLLDQTGAKSKLSLFKKNKKMLKIEKKIKKIIEEHDTEPSNESLVHIELLLRDYEKESIALVSEHQKNKYIVTVDDILSVISDKTGISAKELSYKDCDRLKSVKSNLESQIVGQNEPLDQIYKSLLRAKAGFRNPKKPVVSFLFTGSTGVGKTYAAKLLAESLFLNKNSFIHLDMSEYADKTALNKLIGSSPGYIGSDKGGVLTEKVRKNPHSIILFDEIQKADSDVLSCLFQILEEGRLSDAYGTVIDFTNAIVILTTNIGTSLTSSSTMGFIDTVASQSYQESTLSEVKKYFSPDLLNRLDEIIIFNKLSKQDILNIFSNELKNIVIDMKKRDIIVSFSDEVREYLYKQIQFDNFGARQVNKTVQREIHTLLAEKLLENSPQKIEISVSNDRLACKLL